MKFCVVGAGAWGTAFALHLDRVGRGVALVPRRPEQAALISASRENREYLPGQALPPDRSGSTSDLAEGLRGADVVLLACPAQTLRITSKHIRRGSGSRPWPAPRGEPGKGTGARAATCAPPRSSSEELPGVVVGALSGPTNAAEVARGLPAAMVLATGGTPRRPMTCRLRSAGRRSVYTTDDLAGVEFGGSLKNVYAIAAGCCEGLGLGDNAKAALLTRAVAEMVKVGGALGARPETFYGLSGFGDLVATCHGPWSRNREFGHRIGEGRASPSSWRAEGRSSRATRQPGPSPDCARTGGSTPRS